MYFHLIQSVLEAEKKYGGNVRNADMNGLQQLFLELEKDMGALFAEKKSWKKNLSIEKKLIKLKLFDNK